MKFPRLFDASSRDPEPRIPQDRMLRLHRSFRRRLSDDVEDVFRRACIDSDFLTASGLFAVLEANHARRRSALGQERRISDEAIESARDALARCDERGRVALAAKAQPGPDDAAYHPGSALPAVS